MFLPITLIGVLFAGCVGHAEGEEAAKAKEFNKKDFEGAMVESGKEQELKDAKAREKEYLDAQGGTQEEQR